ncbi:hypothetical protein BDN72DRAFT_862546 [Pluteus cervinus]|uniref:Uncharacterized protein n=1 Tax=Pluteus cervinus TaxID=181527 RepID=A0ACD3AAU2_9AGAR|nr:hypothetical protein BDN72DRAFT_862546 [Pluteus cervinus]
MKTPYDKMTHVQSKCSPGKTRGLQLSGIVTKEDERLAIGQDCRVKMRDVRDSQEGHPWLATRITSAASPTMAQMPSHFCDHFADVETGMTGHIGKQFGIGDRKARSSGLDIHMQVAMISGYRTFELAIMEVFVVRNAGRLKKVHRAWLKMTTYCKPAQVDFDRETVAPVPKPDYNKADNA